MRVFFSFFREEKVFEMKNGINSNKEEKIGMKRVLFLFSKILYFIVIRGGG